MQAYISALIPRQEGTEMCLYILFSGCGFNCPSCNSPDLLENLQEHLVDLKDIKKEIQSQANFLKKVIFTGGEPTLQRLALLDLAKFCKSLNLQICIDTNGSKPETISALLNQDFLNGVILDIKAPFQEDIFEKATKSKTFFIQPTQILEDIKRTLQLLTQNQEKLDIEITTLVTPGILYRKEDLIAIGEQIKDLRCTWIIKKFDNTDVKDKRFQGIEPPSSTFMQDLLEALNKEFPELPIELKD